MAARKLDARRKSNVATKLMLLFNRFIVGQQDPVEALVSIVDKHKSGMYDRSRPIASLLFLGPTGTGKTATAEGFVMGLGGDPTRNLMKIDCAEFQHSHEIAKLVGSPPGYLGHRETHPYFTNASVTAARMDKDGTKEILPFTVLLFDEIEKASDALWNLLLGILDKGSLTTGTNEKVDLKNCVIILTSNVGSAEMSDENTIGFNAGKKEQTDKKLKDIAMAAARRKFAPEFLNRLDKIVMFKTLTEDNLRDICGFQFQNIQDNILLNSNVIFEMQVTQAAIAQILKEGYDPRYNARNLKRVIDQNIYLPLSRMVATLQVMPEETIIVDYRDEEWEYHAVTTARDKSFSVSAG